MFDFLKKLFGARNEREIKKYYEVVKLINNLEPKMEKLTDGELRAKTDEFRERLKNGETLDDLLVETFAVVREASKRTLKLRHFDVQLIGGMVLHQGKIAEMKTGEGKTLVATLPVYLNALTCQGVHVITVNDYLAERDSLGKGNFKGMGNIYNFLGLTVGCIKNTSKHIERQNAYNCDVTYGTCNEFGFDYLRDNMAVYPQEKVQRSLNYAIIDEVDSILIDEARTPLIISGPAEESTELYYSIDRIIPMLIKDVDYQVDEKLKTATLTEQGVCKAEKLLKIPNLYDPQNIEIIHHIDQSLKAHTLFKRDTDYIVKDGQVIIVDEFTGRLMPGRRWSDGLHQAIEAKEKVKIERENQTLATITLQNYFRMYKKLAGMTGTAMTEAEEFWQIYKLDVISVPTNKPMIRIDNADVIYKTEKGKFKAIVNDIYEKYKIGQPVLVGTTSIEKNEKLSELLNKKGVSHNLLNAKNHEKEAEIIAMAGQKNAVTVATNMAGRGTDIVLGEGVKELGGLFVLGTERHESRRIDNQLRGRSGRQGDPGESRFYVSLEDDLMRIFGSEKIKGVMDKMGMSEDDKVEHPWISSSIERAQKSVESHNFSIRKHLLQYDDILNNQRSVIYKKRQDILEGKNLKDNILEMLHEVVKDIIFDVAPEKTYPEEWDFDGLKLKLDSYFGLKYEINKEKTDIVHLTREILEQDIHNKLLQEYNSKETKIGSELMREIERNIMLQVIDSKWREHLYSMDSLKEGIGLRAYAQKDPLLEYKKEGFELFQRMIVEMEHEVIQFLFKVQVISEEQLTRRRYAHEMKESRPVFVVPSASAAEAQSSLSEREMYTNSPEGTQKVETYRREQPKIGRNDLCPCGSGKKYKKCCGKNQ
ncbi:MAG: preprotein translocase subunit SecA [Candidatus Goldbacteria bacterium]|nr:preprotein translocase subunit SecA [Candidatus Goldiibacteriota bacterium]